MLQWYADNAVMNEWVRVSRRKRERDEDDFEQKGERLNSEGDGVWFVPSSCSCDLRPNSVGGEGWNVELAVG